MAISRTPPPPRIGWNYDHYFIEQIKKLNQPAKPQLSD